MDIDFLLVYRIGRSCSLLNLLMRGFLSKNLNGKCD